MVFIADVILAFASGQTAGKVNEVLLRGDIHVSGIIQSGAQVLKATLSLSGCLIICSYNLRDMTAFDLFEKLPESFNMLLLSNEHQYDAHEEGIVCLHIPINQMEFLSIVRLLLADYQEVWSRNAGRREPRSAQESRLILEAKKLLTERYHMSEPQAHRFMQKRSMNTGSKLVDTARLILEGY